MNSLSQRHGMSIILQLRLALIVVCILALGSVILVYYYVGQMSNDSTVVNDAGIVRGQTQRLIKLELANQPNKELVRRIDKMISSLIHGDQELGLPPAGEGEFRRAMNQVQSAWQGLKQIIVQVRRGEEAPLIEASETFFSLANTAVSAAELNAHGKVTDLHTLQLLLLAINLLALLAAWVVLRRASTILRHSIDIISGTASAISSAIEQQNGMSEQQAVAVTETTTTMEELNASFEHTAMQAEQAASQAQNSSQRAQEGSHTVNQTLSEMDNLNDKMGAIATQILQLSEHTGQIGQVTELVSELANQTNLLALNASVQAAHAGDHGRGFAVVAEEIRKLADESKRSADRISDLVGDIQTATNATVMATEEGTKTVESNMRLTQEATSTFGAVVSALQGAYESAQKVSFNIKEQEAAVGQVVGAMESLNNGAREVSVATTQTRKDVERLDQTAKDLNAVV